VVFFWETADGVAVVVDADAVAARVGGDASAALAANAWPLFGVE